jgi:hypothetical protein
MPRAFEVIPASGSPLDDSQISFGGIAGPAAPPISFWHVGRRFGLSRRLNPSNPPGSGANTRPGPVVEFSNRIGLVARRFFIDEGGVHFWGKILALCVGEREGAPLLLFSDRDSGLYILRYADDRDARVRGARARRGLLLSLEHDADQYAVAGTCQIRALTAMVAPAPAGRPSHGVQFRDVAPR